MESNHFLGILLGPTQATIVQIDGQKGPDAITDIITVRQDPQAAEPVSLVSLIGQTLASRALKFDEAAVALESGFYSQYPFRSTFSDPRQIEGTVKFDAEEATAMDAAALAVTFEIMNTDSSGSELMIYSADRQSLTGVLLDLQGQGIDPTVIEPDLVCQGRILERIHEIHEHPECLYVLLGRQHCAVFQSEPSQKSIRSRQFLLGAGDCQKRELIQQLRLSIASWSQGQSVTTIRIGGLLDGWNVSELTSELPCSLERFELNIPVPTHSEDGSNDPTDVVAAWGAAGGLLMRGRKVDFRRDFLPYQGKKRILQTCLRIISVSAAVVLLTVGAYFQFKTFRMQGYVSSLDKKLTEQYQAGMYGQKPPGRMSVATKLRTEYTRIKKIQEGLGPGDDKAVTAKLTFILDAFNKAPNHVDIHIEQIAITERSMRIVGDTNSRRSTLDLLTSLDKHPKLKKETEIINPAPPRDKFVVTLEPEDQK